MIALAWDFAGPFYDGRHAWVCNGCVSVPIDVHDEHHMMEGGRWGVIDRSGRIVVPVDQSKEALKRSPESWNAPPTEQGWRP